MQRSFIQLEPRMEVGVRAAATMGIVSDDVRALFSQLVPGWTDDDFEHTPGGYDFRLREAMIHVRHGGIRLLRPVPRAEREYTQPREYTRCALL